MSKTYAKMEAYRCKKCGKFHGTPEAAESCYTGHVNPKLSSLVVAFKDGHTYPKFVEVKMEDNKSVVYERTGVK